MMAKMNLVFCCEVHPKLSTIHLLGLTKGITSLTCGTVMEMIIILYLYAYDIILLT